MIPRSRTSPTIASRVISTPTVTTSFGVLERRSSCSSSAAASARNSSSCSVSSPSRVYSGSRCSSSHAVASSAAAAARDRVPRAWCQKSRSSARCTKVPLVVQTRRSLGQAFDGGETEGEGAVAEGVDLRRGERAGSSKGTRPDYGGGETVPGTSRRSTERATRGGSSSGPKWPMPATTSVSARAS